MENRKVEKDVMKVDMEEEAEDKEKQRQVKCK